MEREGFAAGLSAFRESRERGAQTPLGRREFSALQVDLAQAPIDVGEIDAVVEPGVQRIGAMVVALGLAPQAELAQDVGQSAVGVGAAEQIGTGPEQASGVGVGFSRLGEAVGAK